MCGRYVLKTSTPELARIFGVEAGASGSDSAWLDAATGELSDITSFNVAPTQMVMTCRSDDHGQRNLLPMRWGLVPSWSKDDKSAARMINARSETVSQRPAFRSALERRRCLVPASGFFEWKREGKHRLPYYFSLRTGEPFAFAGLWEVWRRPDRDDPLISCTILTTEANSLVGPVHGRMPVILQPDSFEAWLDVKAQPPSAILPLTRPLAAREMQAYPVSTLVNNARNNEPRCIEPLADPVRDLTTPEPS